VALAGPRPRVLVAFSGGIDSGALVHALARQRRQLGGLRLVHVDHGLQAASAAWARHCVRVARGLRLPIVVRKADLRPARGASPEAAAREARYALLAQVMEPGEVLVTAQHRDDQVETLLLQLFRGAGVAGLAAMPPIANFGPGRIARPLLEVARADIERQARRYRLKWVEDPSNELVRFDRNFLRQQVFPLLERRFPAYRHTLMRASRHMAEASILLDELAEADRKECAASGRLELAQLRKLSLPRAKNLLRYTLARHGVVLPSALKLDDMLRQMLSSSPDNKIHVIFGDSEIRCFRGQLYVGRASDAKAGKAVIREIGIKDWRLEWHGEEQLVVRELGGVLQFSSRPGAGLNLQKLMESRVIIRARQGGECLRPDGNRPRQTLKNLLREAALPPWERQRLPLIYSGEKLVCVPGIGVDSQYQATAGEEGVVVSWQRDEG